MALTTTASGVKTGDLLYKPWGETRYDNGTTPTTWRFTGQREDATIGLYFYNARYYDAALGRFTQPDTIVPQPGNPGSLNRYSYVLNNPLRYTDPTGFFSEEEIMNYLGVDTWEAVLAMFGEGGQFAGAWGYLQTLLEAEFGDEVTLWTAYGCANCIISGSFYESTGGKLFFQGIVGNNGSVTVDWSVFLFGEAISNVLGHGNTRMMLQVRNQMILPGMKYTRAKYDWNRVDKAGIGLNLVGLAADAYTAGIGGRFVGVAKKVGSGADIVSISLSGPTAAIYALQGDMSPEAASVYFDAAVDVAGPVFDQVPFIADFVGLITGLSKGFYYEP